MDTRRQGWCLFGDRANEMIVPCSTSNHAHDYVHDSKVVRVLESLTSEFQSATVDSTGDMLPCSGRASAHFSIRCDRREPVRTISWRWDRFKSIHLPDQGKRLLLPESCLFCLVVVTCHALECELLELCRMSAFFRAQTRSALWKIWSNFFKPAGSDQLLGGLSLHDTGLAVQK